MMSKKGKGPVEKEDGAFFENKEHEDRFLQWFWRGRNGNDLVKKLNNVGKQEDCIRREKFPPHVYGVVINDKKLFGEKEKQLKLCKVGFTQCATKENENNRMKQVEKEVMKEYSNAKAFFVLRIGAVDTTPYRETEKRIRRKVGKPICKEKANELKLPIPTEWVLTTQKHIDEIVKKKNEKTKEVKEHKDGDVIDFFKDIKEEEIQIPAGYEAWLEGSGSKK